MPTSPKRNLLPALTGLRFFAALAIVLRHFGGLALKGAPLAVRNAAGNGHVAVSLFFVLSGFVLAYSYMDDSGARKTDNRSFWVARLGRIYPAYLAAFVLAAPFFVAAVGAAHSAGGTAVRIVAGGALVLALVQAWHPVTANYWNSPAWSLSVEAFFYLTFPFLAPRLARLKVRPMVLGTLLWLVAITPSLLLLGLHLNPAQASFWMAAAQTFPVLRLAEFLMGVVAGIAFPRQTAPGGVRNAIGAVLAAVAILGVMAWLPERLAGLAGDGAMAPLFLLLIWNLARGGGWLGAVLSWRPVEFLGHISYGVYILQEPFKFLFRFATGVEARDQFPAYLAGLLALAAACFVFLEKPASRWIARTFGARRALRPQPTRALASEIS